MREVICLHVGQAGVNIGNSCWELFCLEHGIQPDGQKPEAGYNQDDQYQTFFDMTQAGKFTPRAVYIDLEPTCIDLIREGPYKNLYHPEQLMSGKEDAANCFANGYHELGREVKDLVLDRVRKIAETCDGLQGFTLFHAFGGGTGSGLGALLLDQLKLDYKKKTNINFAVYPSPRLSSIVLEPINTILSCSQLSDCTDVTFMVDNEAMYNIAIQNLNVSSPQFPQLNRLIAQCLSSVTTSLRFECELNCDLKAFQTNLVPFPKLKYPLCSYAPFTAPEKAIHERVSTAEITTAVFEPINMMLQCDPRLGKYMACCLLYRGAVAPKDVNATISTIKAKEGCIQFVPWCPTGFKVGIAKCNPTVVPNADFAASDKSCCMISNSTAIGEIWRKVYAKYLAMQSTRAFEYIYVGAGMEAGEFEEAKDNVAAMLDEYVEVSRELPEGGQPQQVQQDQEGY